jgi:hypothetical protein
VAIKGAGVGSTGVIASFFCLAGNVADMFLATCRPDSQMAALLADTALSCRRHNNIDPIPTDHFRVGDGRHLPLSSFCTRVRMYEQPAKNMSYAALPFTGFSSLPPWLGQRHHQLMVPPLPIGLRKARTVGLGSATTVGSLVWGANASPIKK